MGYVCLLDTVKNLILGIMSDTAAFRSCSTLIFLKYLLFIVEASKRYGVI